jgi:hypothetical protein
VDQLLLLARFENQKQTQTEKVYLNALFLDTISRFSAIIQNKKKINVTNFRRNII